jgi:hypothetical protein
VLSKLSNVRPRPYSLIKYVALYLHSGVKRHWTSSCKKNLTLQSFVIISKYICTPTCLYFCMLNFNTLDLHTKIKRFTVSSLKLVMLLESENRPYGEGGLGTVTFLIWVGGLALKRYCYALHERYCVDSSLKMLLLCVTWRGTGWVHLFKMLLLCVTWRGIGWIHILKCCCYALHEGVLCEFISSKCYCYALHEEVLGGFISLSLHYMKG